MSRKSSLKERRLETALEAARRWQETAEERIEAEKSLAEGNPASAAESTRGKAFRRREALRRARTLFARVPAGDFIERAIGGLDWDDLPPDDLAAAAGRPVARIIEMPDGGDLDPEGFGTGFMVSPRLLLTNHHVFASASEAEGSGAHFEYERARTGGIRRGQIFELDPDAFFYSHRALDFALVAVKPRGRSGAALDSFGSTRLIAAEGKILEGHPVNIIQHPEGGPKKYATTENKLLKLLDAGYLHYTTDTLRGSSGSPVFNVSWEAVGLHHSSIPMIKDGKILTEKGEVWDEEKMDEDEIQWIANEGIRVSRIVGHLKKLDLGDAAKNALLHELLQLTGDPLTEEAKPDGTPAEPSSITLVQGRETVSNISITINGSATINIYTTATVTAQAPAVEPAAEQPAVSGAEEAGLRFDKDYTNRKGYSASFLTGFEVPPPTVAPQREDELLKGDDEKPFVVPYHHFSLTMNKERRLLMWSAVNVDYSPARRDKRGRTAFGSDTWKRDPRIAAEYQIENKEFYKPAGQTDRGHIVRRDDNAWGDTTLEIEYANSDTFHWTNCTPQHERFNQEKKDGLWGRLESHVTREIEAAGNRAIIFAGPVLDPNDPEINFGDGNIQYPLRFWKVIVGVSSKSAPKTLEAYGFVLDQSDVVNEYGLEKMDFGDFRREQKSLRAITKMTGVVFPKVVLDADVLGRPGPDGAENFRGEVERPESINISKLSDIKFHT
ncbi:MAG TPA: DNA/RNA non-specific endonuclease [Pyrinomonadaceae bacterium]|nr:DNA/RNA non-specific endonuclease [Pyrinomonadaceae bacterium]